jgi:hypothetical protein
MEPTESLGTQEILSRGADKPVEYMETIRDEQTSLANIINELDESTIVDNKKRLIELYSDLDALYGKRNDIVSAFRKNGLGEFKTKAEEIWRNRKEVKNLIQGKIVSVFKHPKKGDLAESVSRKSEISTEDIDAKFQSIHKHLEELYKLTRSMTDLNEIESGRVIDMYFDLYKFYIWTFAPTLEKRGIIIKKPKFLG